MMNFDEATQVLRDEAPSNNAGDEARVGTLKIGSQTHIIRRGFNRIGRSPQCPVIIDDLTVSKVHAEIQAGSEAAFVSDLRSSNGTKIKDVSIKPFYYYSINDGDAIYFGQVKAVYATARSTETEDVLLVPETPVASRNRNATERFSAGTGNISESFLNNSSVCESDISMIPGTQETERKRPTFQKPSTPVQGSPFSRKVEAASKSKIDETASGNDVEATLQPPGAKRLRLEELNDPSNESNIHEAETQAMPSPIAKRKEASQPRHSDDIFEAETQVLPAARFEKQKNRGDIFEAETQISKVSMSEKQKNWDDIFEAETQPLPVAMATKKKIEDQRNRDDIFEAETQAMEVSTSDSRGSIYETETQDTEVTTSREPNSIFEAETQAMEMSVPKSGEKIAKLPGGKILREINRTSSGRVTNDIHEAETQMGQVQLASSEPIGMPENIHDLATQILDTNQSSAGGSGGRLNETIESSYRSNSSRDRLRLSSTPPSSPESVDVEESQNLLEIAETPLLAYEKNCEKISSTEDVPVTVEEPKIGGKKSRVFRRVRTISESSESETDDEKVSPRFVRRSKPSNVIEDSSEEPTDEENVFGGSPFARGNEKGASTREAGPAAAKDRPDPSEVRSSPLRRHKSDERDSDGGEKKDASMSGDFPTVPLRRNDVISRTEVEGELAKGRGDSGDSPTVPSRGNDGNSRTEVEGWLAKGRGDSGDSPTCLAPSDVLSCKKIGETSTSKSGRSSVRLLGTKDGNSPTKNRGEAPEGAKANLLGDSPSGDENSSNKIEAASTSKFGRSVLRLPRKGDRDLPKKNEHGASGQGGAKSNLFGDSPKNDNGSASKNQGESSEAAKNSEKIGNSPKNQGESLESAKNSKKIGDSPKNQGESPEGSKNSKKFGDPSGRTNDSPGKIQADTSSKFDPRSNIFGRPSLRLSRKADDSSPKRTTEKSAKEEEDDIFAAATQRVCYVSVGNASTAREVDQHEGPAARNDEIDIDLLPTQILDVPSSTPLSRRSRYRKNRVQQEQPDDEDLHSAPTQILKESPRGENADDHKQPHGKDLRRTPTQMLRKSPRTGNVDADRHKTKDAGKTIYLDDSLETHLGNILGEKANNDCLDDEGTQMMTQNLVDILQPTQSFSEDTSNRKSSPRKLADNFGQGPSSPARKKMYAPGTLGFVDGEARNSSRELVSADPSPIKAARENREIAAPGAINDESEASDVKAEASSVRSADSSAETRTSRRRRKSAGSATTPTVAVIVPPHSKKEQGGEESQEVEAILGNAVEENRTMVLRKSYAKLKMAKRNVEDKNGDAVAKTPKATRTRITVSVARKVQEMPVVTPTRARRTIAGPPGIPGDDEDRKILFTGVRNDKYDRIVEKLGGTVVSDPSEATVLITDKVRRTFKFLCAVARGIRVVSINWLLESFKASRFLDCERFVLKEAAAEAKYKFTLTKSLQIARNKKLLDGYTIIVTPKVNQPEIHELKGMVEACGGRLLVRPGRNWSAKTVIISREEDYAVAKSYLAKAPKNLKITVQSTEFILTGILRQEVNFVEHELKFE